MLSKVRVIGFALAMLTSPLVFAQSFTAGATLFANNGCDGCHEYLGARGPRCYSRPDSAANDAGTRA